MSPSRGGSYLARRFSPEIFSQQVENMVECETREPVPTLKTFPNAPGASQARRLAWTAFSTKVSRGSARRRHRRRG